MISTPIPFDQVAAIAPVAIGAVAGPATAAVPQTLQSHFAALRHAPTSEVPHAVKRFVRLQASEGLGIDASQTRRVAAPDGGKWDVTPGAFGICLYVESEQAGTCVPTADALAGRLRIQFVEPSGEPGKAESVPTDTPRFQDGVLPDDAVSTTATSRLGRATVTARPNADGLYSLSSTGVVGAVTMHRAGKRSLAITAAKKWAGGPKRRAAAHAADCARDWDCYWDSIPPGHWTGFAFYTGMYGWTATIRHIQVWSDDGNTICGGARNPDQTWAGTFFCTSGMYGVTHDYNGSVRAGYAGPGYPSASVLGRAKEFYDSLA